MTYNISHYAKYKNKIFLNSFIPSCKNVAQFCIQGHVLLWGHDSQLDHTGNIGAEILGVCAVVYTHVSPSPLTPPD